MNRSTAGLAAIAALAFMMPAAHAAGVTSTRLKDVVDKGYGEINLLTAGVQSRYLTMAQLEAFRRDNGGKLAFAVDVNEAASDPEKSASQGVAVEYARVEVTTATGIVKFAPPPDPRDFGIDGPDRDWLLRRQVPHAFGMYRVPLHFNGERWARVPRCFIDCNRPAYPTDRRDAPAGACAGRLADRRVADRALPAGVDMPEVLVQVLRDVCGGTTRLAELRTTAAQG